LLNRFNTLDEVIVDEVLAGAFLCTPVWK